MSDALHARVARLEAIIAGGTVVVSAALGIAAYATTKRPINITLHQDAPEDDGAPDDSDTEKAPIGFA